MHQRILNEEKALEQKREMLKSRGDVLFQVDKGVTSIFEKLLYVCRQVSFAHDFQLANILGYIYSNCIIDFDFEAALIDALY